MQRNQHVEFFLILNMVIRIVTARLWNVKWYVALIQYVYWNIKSFYKAKFSSSLCVCECHVCDPMAEPKPSQKFCLHSILRSSTKNLSSNYNIQPYRSDINLILPSDIQWVYHASNLQLCRLYWNSIPQTTTKLSWEIPISIPMRMK